MKALRTVWLALKNCVFVRAFWLLAGVAIGLGMVIYEINTDKKWAHKWFKCVEF